MKARYRVQYTSQNGKTYEKLFSNKIKMIKFVMFLTRDKGRVVYWEDLTGDHMWFDVPANLLNTKEWEATEV